MRYYSDNSQMSTGKCCYFSSPVGRWVSVWGQLEKRVEIHVLTQDSERSFLLLYCAKVLSDH